jgi:hypothetical protein
VISRPSGRILVLVLCAVVVVGLRTVCTTRRRGADVQFVIIVTNEPTKILFRLKPSFHAKLANAHTKMFTSLRTRPIATTQVLKRLPWNEDRSETEDVFLDKYIEGCKVFSRSGQVDVVLELSSKDSGSHSLVHLLGCPFGESSHYICHAFLSGADTGIAIDAFPTDQKITGVCNVSRVETSRHWTSGGNNFDDGCVVSGIKLSFEQAANDAEAANDAQVTQDAQYLSIVLHCWGQCKTIPYCGDAASPRYTLPTIESTTIGTLQEMMQGSLSDSLPFFSSLDVSDGLDVGLLPSDFLLTLGHAFSPIDTSGMGVLDLCPCNAVKFGCVKSSLGIGKWSKEGPIFKFREKWTPLTEAEGFLMIEHGTSFGHSSSPSVDWLRTFQEMTGKESETPEAIVLCGHYNSVAEFLHMPDHLLISRETNGCVPGRVVSQPKLLCSPNIATQTLQTILTLLELNNEHGKQKLSVRFTAGPMFLDPSEVGQRVEAGVAQALERNFVSSLQIGSQGGSLGYHLVMGSQGRRVCTLQGSRDDLLSDLQGTLFSNNQEIAAYRGLLQTKQIDTLLAPEIPHRISGEVMSLRIVHPTLNAAIACAAVLGGTVPYDVKNNAIYPCTYGKGGSIVLAKSCAIIIEILETMKRLDAGSSMANVWIRFCEIH